MRAELLHFDGCPNAGVAERRLHDALRIAGRRDVRVDRLVVATPEQAAEVGFVGSPTIRMNDQDPFATGDEHVGLACRMYATPDGLSGSPTVEQIVEALT